MWAVRMTCSVDCADDLQCELCGWFAVWTVRMACSVNCGDVKFVNSVNGVDADESEFQSAMEGCSGNAHCGRPGQARTFHRLQ